MPLIRLTLDVRTEMDPSVLFHRVQTVIDEQPTRFHDAQIVGGSAEPLVESEVGGS